MKRAVIDIGTNSLRLLVAEMQNGKIKSGKKHVRMVRLGEMVDRSGVIGEDALGRCMNVLKEFVEMAATEKDIRIKALATSAVRDAKNRKEIVDRIESELPIDVEILSGDEEAEMGYFGVLSSFEAQGVFMMVDIGGGSTEFALGSRDRIYYKKSIDMGAVRMTEQFIKSDPVDLEDSIDLERHIRNTIKNNLSDINVFDKGTLIGIGGTITTLGAIKLKMGKYDRGKIHLTSISKGEIRGIVGELGRIPLESRKSIIGLDSERADIIYAGSVILQEILNYFGCNDIVISDCDNLEGYLMMRQK
ncbi:MAG: Ppx/GppA family phosphatase [Peptostreptococcaceae bacterium]|nr:Ppx/GppA family phosphatase [Peptostreptococcaceae bacterium]